MEKNPSDRTRSRRITDGLHAADKLASGMRGLAQVVAVTLGPGGRHVMLQDRAGRAPNVSKDGVTVARAMEMLDREEEMGLRLLRDAALRISASVGDGTTTAIILAAELATRCLALAATGVGVLGLREGLARGAATVLAEIAAMTEPAGRETLKMVACAAANGDERIGALLAEAYERVGVDGVIEVEMGDAVDDVVDVKLGTHFETLALVRQLLPPTGMLDLRKPLILFHDGELTEFEELLPALEVARHEQRPLFVLTGDVGESVETGLLRNRRAGVVDVAVARAPMFGETRADCLEDLAALFGGTAFTDRSFRSLETLELSDLGSADSAALNTGRAVIQGAHGNPVALRERIVLLRREIEDSERATASPTGQSDYVEKRQDRLKILLGATATVHVGGATDLEIKARLPLVENARRAMLAAAESGVLPGGGVAMFRAAQGARKSLVGLDDDAHRGAEALFTALETPLRWIVRNAGYRAEDVVSRLSAQQNLSDGFDARRGRFCDLRQDGVLDSFLMVRESILTAVSVAGSTLSTGALVSMASAGPEPERFHGTERVYDKLVSAGALDT
ncbi:hypothetical protein CJ010_10810 [Azoarcus sp. DD4]|uniref:chaperonin GroEL n=1 Tax=Azoarcus sp. DD4 TaxID=2027405 RepID=UPI00112A1019|nr:chaperonin GroEL [Azoarcus sp. DD4]QDF96981.1 hypothetical protein CJ010_10810 [Azoarcus sp. DD4]